MGVKMTYAGSLIKLDESEETTPKKEEREGKDQFDKFMHANSLSFFDIVVLSSNQAWNEARLTWKKIGREREEYDYVSSLGYGEKPTEYEEGVKEKVELVNPRMEGAFSWVKTNEDYDMQEEVLKGESELEEIVENRDGWGGNIARIIGDLLDPIATGEIIMSGGIGGGIKSIGKQAARSAERWINNTAGRNVVKFVDVVNNETAKKLLGSASSGATNMAVFSVLHEEGKKYVGFPVENIGSNIVLNSMVGAALGSAHGLIGTLLKKRKENIEVLTEALKEKISNGFENSKLEIDNGSVVIDGDKETSKKFSSVLNMFPVIQGMNSESSTIRKVTSAFFRHQFPQREESGVSTPIESGLIQWIGLKDSILSKVESDAKKFIRSGGSLDEFYKDVHHALISRSEASNEMVSSAVSNIRKGMDELTKEALTHGALLEEQLIENEGYVHRVFDLRAIREDPDRFIDTIKEKIIEEQGLMEVPVEIKKEAEDIALETYRTILGVSAESSPTLKRVYSEMTPSALKERTLKIGSLDLFDYIVHDPHQYLEPFFRGLGFETEKSRVLKELGFSDWKEVVKAAEKDFANRSLGKSHKKAISDLDLLIKIPKIVSGEISQDLKLKWGNSLFNRGLEKVLDGFQMLNVVTLLGKVGLTVLEDLAITSSKKGTCRHIGNICKDIFGKSIKSLSKEELVRFGIAAESMQNQIKYLTSEGGWGEKIASKFFKLTGITQINDYRSEIISNDIILDLVDMLTKKKEMETRLSKESQKLIRSELKKHMRYEDSIPDLNINAWSFEAKRDFMGEVERILRQEIIIPGAGDVPLVMRHSVGKLLTLFQRFNAGLTTNVILPMVESGVKKTKLAELMVYGYGWALLRNVIDGYLRNNPYDFNDPKLYENAIKRMPLGIFNMLMGAGELVRSPSEIFRNLAESENRLLEGGVLRYPINLTKAFAAFSKRNYTERDLRNFIGLIPFNNLVFIQPILDWGFVPDVVEHYKMKKSKTRKERYSKSK
jgi:hypothetical protein